MAGLLGEYNMQVHVADDMFLKGDSALKRTAFHQCNFSQNQVSAEQSDVSDGVASAVWTYDHGDGG